MTIFGLFLLGMVCLIIAGLIETFILWKVFVSDRFVKQYTKKVVRISEEITNELYLDGLNDD